MPSRSRAGASRKAVRPASPRFDIVFAGDFAVTGRAGLGASAKAVAAMRAGYRVGLLHLATDSAAPIIAEMQQAAEGAAILPPEQPAATRLLILHAEADPAAVAARARHIAADRTVAVLGGTAAVPPDAAGDIALMPEAPFIRAALAGAKAPLARRDWPMLATPPGAARPRMAPAALRLGWDLGEAHAGGSDIAAIATAAPQAELFIRTPAPHLADVALPGNVTLLDSRGTSASWFIGHVDALLCTGAAPDPAVIAMALAADVPVILPSVHAASFKGAVIAAEPRGAVAAVTALRADRKQQQSLARKAKAFVRSACSEEGFLRLLASLAGAPPRKAKRDIPLKSKPRVLFMPKGGVGIGHVMRLLAVARRAGRDVEPVFATFSEQAGLIERFGFRSEYIPGAAYTGADTADWSPWFETELHGLIGDYGARAVVFDGSDPPPGLASAVASRAGCRLAWMRRAMWEPGYDPDPVSAAGFDLIIEPGELAAARDRGATAARRHEARIVAPVMLLDRGELLPRAEAARALGLDPARPAVLLQLGSGENRDVAGLMDAVIARLEIHDGLQIAAAEWANSAVPLNLWDNVRLIRGAPLSHYFNAFDFSIAAAGYNTFHEVIHFGLPTVFIPNTAPGMDDQRARALFAQEAGAAIEIGEDDLSELPQVLGLMMNEALRGVMRRNCDALAGGNGAAEASALIASLVH